MADSEERESRLERYTAERREIEQLLNQAHVPMPNSRRLPDRIRFLIRERDDEARKARNAYRMPWRR